MICNNKDCPVYNDCNNLKFGNEKLKDCINCANYSTDIHIIQDDDNGSYPYCFIPHYNKETDKDECCNWKKL